MQVRTYRARSLEEALQRVQQELGPDSKIVHARELQTGWWERFARGRHFEIRTRRRASTPASWWRRDAALEPAAEQGPVDVPVERSSAIATRPVDPLELPPRTSSFERTSDRRDDRLGSAAFDALTFLLDADVSAATARELMELVRDQIVDPQATRDDWLYAIAQALARELPVGGPVTPLPGRCHTVALVGPTGVGKTTTVAKLAAHWRLKEQRRVGLITLDTYRVAAVEQLKTYAEILEVPLEVVTTPREMRQAMARFSELDSVLIDTAGRSPHETLPLQGLKAMLAEAGTHDVQLVLSGASSVSHLRHAAAHFLPLGVTSLLVTKVDEAVTLGNLLPVWRETRLPIRYLTCGQNVPDDIRTADRGHLIRAFLGLEKIMIPTIH